MLALVPGWRVTKTRPLRGMAVTELGFGGASLGNLYLETSDTGARLAVDAAWDGGVRYYDTAPYYGLGLSERRLGAALAARSAASTPGHTSRCRARYFFASFRPEPDGLGETSHVRSFRAGHLRR